MIQLQEHDMIPDVDEQNKYFSCSSLVSWCKPNENAPFGYYASFKIGAEWLGNNEALVVTTKREMENIDFLDMFMTCFSSDLSIESFSKIYSIQQDKPAIKAPALKAVVSPLIILHFLGVVNRIKTLKKGYVHHCQNLKKIKGRIAILQNDRTNISIKRYDRIYCQYDEYSEDIPENRLLKKALLYANKFISAMEHYPSYGYIKHILAKKLSQYENVSDIVEIKEVKEIKKHKLFKDYAEAIRLAKLVLRHFDYSINKTSDRNDLIVPFVLDMSLLYEHYVYGLLHNAYPKQIEYQFGGITGYPDFLYCSKEFKAILDTKYIPRFEHNPIDTYIIRQLSGYGRDIAILKKLGYTDMTEETPTPPVPCIIIYPKEDATSNNPFINNNLKELCASNKVHHLSMLYKIEIPLPTIPK